MGKILISITVLYALSVGIYFLRIRTGKKPKKNIIGKGSKIHETGPLKSDIIGKSRFDLNALKPLNAKEEPLGAEPSKSEKREENHDTFAASNQVKSSIEVPQEELDETFCDTPPDQDNQPMDIDYSLEYEEDWENQEEEEVEGAARSALASGVEFEDLGHAIRTINRKEEATPKQKQKAGETLLEVRKTDLFELMVSGKPDAKRIVHELMAESLSAFYESKDIEARATGNPKKVPDSFNIRDFA